MQLDTTKLNAAMQQIPERTRRGLANAAMHVLKEAKKRAPVDTGDLRGSGAIQESGDGLSQTMSFNTPYAAAQHEHVEYHHEEGQAKYLESVLVEQHDDILKIIAGGKI